MRNLLHLCKKDFAFADIWIHATWLVLVAVNVLPWISPAGDEGIPFLMFNLLAPAVMIFLTSARIIHCDSFVGTSGFMGTRPVRATTLLRNKLLLIACVLILPAVGFAMLHAACMQVNLSALEWFFYFVENLLHFSLIAAVAVAYAVISPSVGLMVVLVIATPSLFLMLLSAFNLNWPLAKSLEDQHLRDSFLLVAQAFLSIAAIAIAMSWVATRRLWLTVTGFLLCAAFLIWPKAYWKWNFVDELSRDAKLEQIAAEQPVIQWLSPPRLTSHERNNGILKVQVARPGRIKGLKDDWTGRLLKFESTALFSDGGVLESKGYCSLYPYDDSPQTIIRQLGLHVHQDHPMRSYEKYWDWTLFECDEGRLKDMTGNRATIRGNGTFQISRPVVLTALPPRAGASAVIDRFRYRINRLTVDEGQIFVSLSIHGVPLRILGDNSRKDLPHEIILVNRETKQFAHAIDSVGSSSAGNELITVHRTLQIDQESGPNKKVDADEFLRGAELYVIGTHYGGNIALPFEFPDMLLEEKR